MDTQATQTVTEVTMTRDEFLAFLLGEMFDFGTGAGGAKLTHVGVHTLTHVQGDSGNVHKVYFTFTDTNKPPDWESSNPHWGRVLIKSIDFLSDQKVLLDYGCISKLEQPNLPEWLQEYGIPVWYGLDISRFETPYYYFDAVRFSFEQERQAR